MIRLGLRLTFGAGRDTVVCLAMTGAAVAIGVVLLLITVAGINAVDAQNDRYAWLETGFAPDSFGSDRDEASASGEPDASESVDPVWWRLRGTFFDGEPIARVDVAATGPDAPVPPGFDALPGPGEFHASPALAELLESTPADQLQERFGGTPVGTIGSEGLPSPDSLIVVVGRDVDELAVDPHAARVTSISTTSPSECRTPCAPDVGIDARGITLVLSVVVAALLVPVLIFIGAATRLSAARREQRFAAMRLVGATPRQVSVMAAVESGVAAVMGVVGGFVLFAATRSTVARLPFTGERFFPSDLSLGLAETLVVATGVPVAAAVAARLAIRSVQISPLGVSRRVTPRPPRAWRLIPLAAGFAELGSLVWVGPPDSTDAQAFAYLSGVVLVMVGLVLGGPWLTFVAARALARRTGRAAVLLAGRRLSDDPKAGFRAISGLIVAVFVGSTAIGMITTIVAYGGASEPGGTDGGTLVQEYEPSPIGPASGETSPVAGQERPGQTEFDAVVADSTIAELSSLPGVAGVTLIHASPDAAADDRPGPRSGLVSCDQLAKTPSFGFCPDGAETVTLVPDFGGAVVDQSTQATTTWPAAGFTRDDLEALPVTTVVVGTDGSTAAIESARTALENANTHTWGAMTLDEISARKTEDIAQLRQLANVIVLTSLPIAGCSLAVNIAGGLSDRKRPFSLLRLTGVPLTMLRRVVALESAVPLLLTAAVAAGSGFVTAQLFLNAQMNQTLQPPGFAYYVVVVVGLAASLCLIASTLPLLRRLTGPETARNE